MSNYRFTPSKTLYREAKNGVKSSLMKIAKIIAEEASATAPRLTGAMASGYSVVDKRGVRVVNDDPLATIKEYGTRHTPAHKTLTSAGVRHGRYRGWK